MKKTEFQYRKLKPSDSKDYRELRLESLKLYPNSFGARYAVEKQSAKLSYQKYIETSHLDNFVIGAFAQNTLIGICGFYRQVDHRCRHRGNIIQMYVQQKYQGKGIGFNLLKTMIHQAFKIKGIEQIELGVMTNVKSASKIYEKAGFQEYGLQKNYFKLDDVYLDLKLMVLFR